MWNIFQKWVNDGSNLKKGKSFQNMRNRPLINGPLEQLILEVFNPMELHLLLGRLSLFKNVVSGVILMLQVSSIN